MTGGATTESGGLRAGLGAAGRGRVDSEGLLACQSIRLALGDHAGEHAVQPLRLLCLLVVTAVLKVPCHPSCRLGVVAERLDLERWVRHGARLERLVTRGQARERLGRVGSQPELGTPECLADRHHLVIRVRANALNADRPRAALVHTGLGPLPSLLAHL